MSQPIKIIPILASLFLIQSVPEIFTNQIQILGETPALTFLFFGLTALMYQKHAWSLLLLGGAISTKLNFILFAPAVIMMIGLKRENRRIRKSLLLIGAFLFLPLLTQAIQIFSYGLKLYIGSYQYYFNWIFNISGALQIGAPENEWLTYGPRAKTIFLLSIALPIWGSIRAIYKREWNDSQVRILLIFTLLLSLAAFHWFFLANYQWWRRSLYFMIPGLVFGMMELQNKLRKKPQIFLFFLSGILFIHNAVTYYRQHPPLKEQDRVFIPMESHPQFEQE